MAKRQRNDCISAICKAKANFITSELGENWNDSKKFWKHIHEVIPMGNKSQKIISLTNQNSQKEIEVNDVAEFINSFIANIGPTLSKNLIPHGSMREGKLILFLTQ